VEQSGDMSCLSDTVPIGIDENKGVRRHRWLPVLIWAVFGAGLLVQAFGPRLKITNNTFVIPPSLLSDGKDIRPAELITYERNKQLVSGTLVVGGALGLALYYRNVLVSSLLSLFQTRQSGPLPLPLKSPHSRAEHQKEQKRKDQNDTS
jgi:hypothetical protein